MINFIDLHGVLVDFIGSCNKTFEVDIYSEDKYHGDWHAPHKVIEDFVSKIDRQPDLFWESMRYCHKQPISYLGIKTL